MVASAYTIETVIMLYSASLSMSAFYQNNLLLRKACNSSVPFGDCTAGEARAQHVVSVIYSWKAIIQYIVPVALVLLAGEHRSISRKMCVCVRLCCVKRTGKLLTSKRNIRTAETNWTMSGKRNFRTSRNQERCKTRFRFRRFEAINSSRMFSSERSECQKLCGYKMRF